MSELINVTNAPKLYIDDIGNDWYLINKGHLPKNQGWRFLRTREKVCSPLKVRTLTVNRIACLAESQNMCYVEHYKAHLIPT
jgi:hypothetical protein